LPGAQEFVSPSPLPDPLGGIWRGWDGPPEICLPLPAAKRSGINPPRRNLTPGRASMKTAPS
jgi:hypothetical protein